MKFRDFLDHDIAAQTCKKLKKIKDEHVRALIEQIPKEWEIDTNTRKAWIEFIVSRAGFLSNNFLAMTGLRPVAKQRTFSLEE